MSSVKNRWLVGLFMMAVACLITPAADDKKPMTDDPIAIELTKAKEEYQEAWKGAAEKLMAAFTEQQKKLENTTKPSVGALIKQLDQIQDEKKAFEADPAKLPKSLSMKVAVSDYERTTAAAKKKCEAAFDKAAEGYRGKKDLVTAKLVLTEKEQFLKGIPAAATADPFQPKSVWKGTRTFTKGPSAGKVVESELHVKERKGDAFKGITINAKENMHEVEGTIKDGKIEWKNVKIISGNVDHPPHAGELKGDKITVETKNATAAATVELKLEKKK